MIKPQKNFSIAQRIANVALSPSHRQIAAYVLDRPLRVATMPVAELASATGASIATTNRFARALGFEGYAHFRAALVLGFEADQASFDKPADGESDNITNVFNAVLDEVVANIERTRQGLDALECARAVNAILSARRIFVLGFGRSSWLAGLLFHDLERYCEQVRLLSSIEGPTYAAQTIQRLNAEDLVIMIEFPPYSSETVLLARRVFETEAGLMAVSDGPHSPIASLSSITLYTSTACEYCVSVDSVALALMEVLTRGIAHASDGSGHLSKRPTQGNPPGS